MADVHDEARTDGPPDAPADGSEHAEVGQALDGIEAALDEVAATIARMS